MRISENVGGHVYTLYNEHEASPFSPTGSTYVSATSPSTQNSELRNPSHPVTVESRLRFQIREATHGAGGF